MHRLCDRTPIKLSFRRRKIVNNDILKGKWLQMKGDVRSWWSKLTDDDVDAIQGDSDRFIGKLRERYGYGREQAERELNDFMRMPDGQRKRTA
jgi:uncharacterized protein YjbJ (UPF0337 family)